MGGILYVPNAQEHPEYIILHGAHCTACIVNNR